jgi:Na+-translocating ferredoxin:NAD+ oxidoreductase subunit E
MKKQVTLAREFLKGIWEINPVFKQVLGLCPTLAVTVSVLNGVAMGIAATFVLVCSSFLISLLRKWIPSQVRIAFFIVVIATFVTIADLVMKAKLPELSKALGPFIPLIVVNCVILGRQEAFSSRNKPLRSVFDALGIGAGFTLALIALGGVREVIGSRTFFGFPVLPDQFEPWLIMILPAGAFLTFGLMMGFANMYTDKKARVAKDKQLGKLILKQDRQLIKEAEV